MVLVVYYKHDYGWDLETKELVRYVLRKLEKLETLYDLREMISL